MPHILGTELSVGLAADIQRITQSLRANPDSVEASDIQSIVYRMTEESLRYQFIGTCEKLGLSNSLLKLVNMTVSGSLKTTHYGLKKVIPKLSTAQRIELANFLEQTVYDIE